MFNNRKFKRATRRAVNLRDKLIQAGSIRPASKWEVRCARAGTALPIVDYTPRDKH